MRRRRRRLGARLAAVGALLLASLAVAGLGLTVLQAFDGGIRRTSAASALGVAPKLASSSAPITPALSPGAVALEGVDAFELSFAKPPRAGIVFDVETGRVLWRRHPTATVPIASLTKIMTALLVAERTTSRERVKVTRAALAYSGSGIGVLPRGRRVPIEGLLHGLLLVSGNDAAIALADHVSGSERRFVQLMNQRARELRLTCTRFASSHGLEPANRSCAADLAALSRVAMGERRIARVVRKARAAVPFPLKSGRLHLNSTNPLLRARYPGTIGLKTGYTQRAGRSYVAVVHRGRRTLGVVLLNSPNPPRQARRLLTAAFRSEAATH